MVAAQAEVIWSRCKGVLPGRDIEAKGLVRMLACFSGRIVSRARCLIQRQYRMWQLISQRGGEGYRQYASYTSNSRSGNLETESCRGSSAVDKIMLDGMYCG